MIDPAGSSGQLGNLVPGALQTTGVARQSPRHGYLEVAGRIGVEAGDDADPFATTQIQCRLADAKMVVAVGQAALALQRQVEVLAPVVARGDGPTGRFEVEREPVRMANAELPVVRFDQRLEVPRPAAAVVITRIDQQSDLQRELALGGLSGQPTEGDVSGVRPMFHPHALFDRHVADGEAPYRHAALQAERLDMYVSRRRDGSVAPAIGEQRRALFAVDQRRIGLGEYEVTPQRWLQRRHQQPVIAACERAGDGTGGVSAAAVGQPPLAALGLIRLAADFSAKTHDSG
ncbi:MAG: hypothetical protein AW09_000906 [Candidatus Accumulibacter phosphatis]|uniref:Uncharacterized protein n=1 Tax=Candidatus Accumulibacter phosphatis TaxID=327160 RepID=A0A080LYC5_9PROT|nr:MAG: hypothetical protein AW09_000906 [Candidatus Accumulibacter phosphatis]